MEFQLCLVLTGRASCGHLLGKHHIFAGRAQKHLASVHSCAREKTYTLFTRRPEVQHDYHAADEIIAKKLNGADEVIVNEGDSLSGGEKQRIALARAYIRHRPVLILDEGTSAIDKDTTEQIESSLLNEDGLTLIAITHDVSPEHLSKFDRVIAL